jgi:hypothetical protein
VLGRYTAAVYHLMLVLEIGLNVVAGKLGILPPIDAQRNWGNMLNTIKQQIDTRKKTPTPDWHAIESDVEHAYTFLVSVKGTWRNPTMHVEKHYDESEARAIHGASRSFMRQVVRLK